MLTPFSQARWCEWHGRHKVQRSDWRGGQPLDITCSTCPEKGRKPLVLHQLSKPECHKEGLLSALKDQQHPRNTDRSKVVLYIRPEKWVMAGSTASWRQREDGLLHWANTVAINSHAFQPLPCPGDIWMANGVFLGRPDLQCWQPTMETTWLSNCKTHTHTPLHPPKSENGQWLHEGIIYDQLANSAGFQECDQVWFYHPTQKRGKSPKLQSSWDSPYNVATQINVIDQIQQHLRPFCDVFVWARQRQEKVLSRKAEIDRKCWARASGQSGSCSRWTKCASDRWEFGEAVDEQLLPKVSLLWHSGGACVVKWTRELCWR